MKTQTIKNVTRAIVALSIFLAAGVAANAQATRTWVSGVGDDANPGSRTAPCKTFAGAISKTAAGGEIDALDPGGFGTLTITKAITICGDSTMAGILASGNNGVNVQAGASDVVVLRNINFSGVGSGLSGVHFVSGKQLVIENCKFKGFTVNDIDIAATAGGNVVIKDCTITGGAIGISTNTTSGTLNVEVEGTSIKGAATGIYVPAGKVQITNSTITQSANYGLLANGGIASFTNSTVSGCGTGVLCQPSSIIRIAGDDIVDNNVGIVANGIVSSGGNNRNAGNTTPGAPTAGQGMTIQ